MGEYTFPQICSILNKKVVKSMGPGWMGLTQWVGSTRPFAAAALKAVGSCCFEGRGGVGRKCPQGELSLFHTPKAEGKKE